MPSLLVLDPGRCDAGHPFRSIRWYDESEHSDVTSTANLGPVGEADTGARTAREVGPKLAPIGQVSPTKIGQQTIREDKPGLAFLPVPGKPLRALMHRFPHGKPSAARHSKETPDHSQRWPSTPPRALELDWLSGDAAAVGDQQAARPSPRARTSVKAAPAVPSGSSAGLEIVNSTPATRPSGNRHGKDSRKVIRGQATGRR
jgi:hypothetical protein